MNEKEKARETLLVLALASLVFLGFIKEEWPLAGYAAAFFLFIALFVPPLARTLHRFWIGLAQIIGTVNTRILLTLVFFLLLTPLALIRRLTSSDPLQLKPPKNTVFTVREEQYSPEDLKNPY